MTLHPLISKGGAFVLKLGVVFRKRQVSVETCRFQLNPPLRVGEIVFDDEIQLRWVQSASTADGWI